MSPWLSMKDIGARTLHTRVCNLNPLTHNKQCLKPQLDDENDKIGGVFGTMIIEKRRHCMQQWSE